MINDQPTVLLCFSAIDDSNRCRSLIRKNDVELSYANNFSFNNEFDLDTVDIPNSKYGHHNTKMANYKGYPMVLGSWNNVKLEMLFSTEFSLKWIDQIDYPFSTT